jgi:lipoprotein-releasing system permease protein
VSFHWFVASRYLRAKGRSRFRALITVLAVGGVTVGVAAAITVLGALNGFTKCATASWHNAHILDPAEKPEHVDELRERVAKFDGVVATAPFVFGKVLLTSDRESEGAILRGIDPTSEAAVTDVMSRIFPRDASFDLRDIGGAQAPGIVLGKDLASRLRVHPGDQVVATVPDARRRGIPRMRSFIVTGTFESGIYEYDSALALASIDASRDALDLGSRVTGILVRVHKMEEAPAIGKKIMTGIQEPALWANDWIRQNRQLFLWMKIEKIVGYLLFGIILVVAAFLISSTLIMIVLEKTREIGVLLSLGAGRQGVRTIFLFEGMAIGGFGTLLGCLVGWGLCVGLDHYRLPLPGRISSTRFP